MKLFFMMLALTGGVLSTVYATNNGSHTSTGIINTSLSKPANAQTTFIHPGGLHTQADLDRMRIKVAEGAQPWLAGWQRLIADPDAQNTYTPAPRANMGGSRQRASRDAHAAYLNTIRWHISGDASYAECAARILNAWSSTVNQVPTGTDIPGLSGIPIFEFALAGELLRIYGGWAPADFDRFKNMMLTYFYPVCNDFLVNHNGACITHYWANWDACNLAALIAIGVLCDNQAIYDEGVEYFKNGAGAGSVMNAVYFIHPGNLGQWQESGRDQEHAQLGVGLLAAACEVAWNQGLDLYGYADNRLLAGAEYVARTNLLEPVPFTTYNNCDDVNHYYLSINGLGRLDDRPVWEMVYNHYVVRRGLSAPNVQKIAELMRPEHGSIDHFGYGTLTFTLNAPASPFPPSPIPPTPTGLTATAGVGRVMLSWTPSIGSTAQGYRLQRAATSGGPYTTIASWTDNTFNQRTDTSVTNGTTYYYVLAAINQAGTSPNSGEVSATPMAPGSLPSGWFRQDVGAVNGAGGAGYANVSDNTFIVSGNGSGIGGMADSLSYAFGGVSGDVTITARLLLNGSNKVGLMMRESPDANAKALSLTLGDVGGRETRFGTRASTGGPMTFQLGNAYTWTPAWYRLNRSGNTFTAFQSLDGVTWSEIGSSSVAMTGDYFVGLAAVGGTATFDNVTIAEGGAPPPAPTGLLATAISSSRIALSWAAAPGAPGYSVKRATTAGGPYTTISTGVISASYLDIGLTPSATYYYVVSAGNLAGESADSAPANATTLDLRPPLAPTGLVAASGDARVALNWTSTEEAIGYNVKRAAASGGPYTTIGTSATATYADVTAANGENYYYVVSAINAAGESPDSSEISGTPVPGRRGYWAFDETGGASAADSWGGRNGALGSGASFVTGAIGNAVRLNGGSEGHVTLPAGVVESLNDFTIAAWVKLDASPNWARVFDFGSGTSVNMFLTSRNGNDGSVRYAITTGGGGAEQRINTNVTLATGVWTHLAVTLSGNTGVLYVNGVEAGRNSNMTLRPSSLGDTTQNWIGRSQYPDPPLPGVFDDFRIYNLGLSASEIHGLFTSYAPVITSGAHASGMYGAPFSYAIEATNEPFLFSATGLPPGLSVNTNTGVISGAPAATGAFAAAITAANNTGLATTTLNIEIAKAAAAVTFDNIRQVYDGAPKLVIATTVPAALNVVITYNGGDTPPIYPGEHAVVATVNDANFAGSASGILVIRATALVRHAPIVNGVIDGSIQALLGENITLNSGARITGDLLAPGMPGVQINGDLSFGGVNDGPGGASPDNYRIVLNNGALLRSLVRRIDPIAITTVVAPPAPAGTRDVVISNPTQSPGDFATLRNLTLNSNAGLITAPPGAYGAFTANGGNGFILGVAGANEPSVYNLQSLTLNGAARLQIVGPVILTIAGGVTINGDAGAPGHPEWLRLRIAGGGLTLNGNASFHGYVIAPAGAVIINQNSALFGGVICDRLTINGAARLSNLFSQ
ncbi:MAG TPA: LamG-like jellyroll fold domain-containing protein [Blastocatellia bacterium]|jgi:fibronectin type 3 domain-containing protein|nr:LamG-like jellyroll fold domain-containing protein [Blastocatellia bacterium]